MILQDISLHLTFGEQSGEMGGGGGDHLNHPGKEGLGRSCTYYFQTLLVRTGTCWLLMICTTDSAWLMISGINCVALHPFPMTMTFLPVKLT